MTSPNNDYQTKNSISKKGFPQNNHRIAVNSFDIMKISAKIRSFMEGLERNRNLSHFYQHCIVCYIFEFWNDFMNNCNGNEY